MKLFGHPESGHAFKVKFCLSCSGMEHDYEHVDIFKPLAERSAEFIANSKFGEVPLLIDEGETLIQSNAILAHIATKYGVYAGENDQDWQTIMEWLVWEPNKIGMCLPQLRANKKFDPFLNAGAEQWLQSRYDQDVTTLDNTLSDGRQFIIGDDLTVADFSLSGYLMVAEEAKLEVPTNVTNWLNRLRDLEGWASHCDLLS